MTRAALRAVALAAALWGGALDSRAENGRASVDEMEASVCAALAEQGGEAALGRAIDRAGWELGEALETARCRYVFVDGGAPALAGHHIVARWRNQKLIPWIADYYRGRDDPEGVARVFGRQGRNGDALDYLDRMVAQFEEGDPEMAKLFAEARAALREAMAPPATGDGADDR